MDFLLNACPNPWACKYEKYGCEFAGDNPVQMKEHEAACLHRMAYCPMNNCRKVLSHFRLLCHTALSNHDIVIKGDKFALPPLRFDSAIDGAFWKPCRFTVPATNDTFWCLSENKDQKTYFVVLYDGTAPEAQSFSCQFRYDKGGSSCREKFPVHTPQTSFPEAVEFHPCFFICHSEIWPRKKIQLSIDLIKNDPNGKHVADGRAWDYDIPYVIHETQFSDTNSSTEASDKDDFYDIPSGSISTESYHEVKEIDSEVDTFEKFENESWFGDEERSKVGPFCHFSDDQADHSADILDNWEGLLANDEFINLQKIAIGELVPADFKADSDSDIEIVLDATVSDETQEEWEILAERIDAMTQNPTAEKVPLVNTSETDTDSGNGSLSDKSSRIDWFDKD